MDNDTITISIEEYEMLVRNSDILRLLYAGGVDNWEGYSYSLESLNDDS